MLISDWSSDVCSSDLLTGKPFEAALKHFRETHPVFKGIRRVRVREPLNVIPIRDKAGRAYKAYKGDANARFDVWRLPSGKWTADIVSMFDAHRADQSDSRRHPAATKEQRLRQNDMPALQREGVEAAIAGRTRIASRRERGC